MKSHIGRIFTKLDLRDRAAAIVYAYDHGVVTPSSGRLRAQSATTPRMASAPNIGSIIAREVRAAAQHVAAVDVDQLAGDPLRGIAEQEQRQVRHVLHLAGPR